MGLIRDPLPHLWLFVMKYKGDLTIRNKETKMLELRIKFDQTETCLSYLYYVDYRFESVHPSIYAIYDLIEHIPDPLLAQQIREHVVCIEGKTKIDINL